MEIESNFTGKFVGRPPPISPYGGLIKLRHIHLRLWRRCGILVERDSADFSLKSPASAILPNGHSMSRFIDIQRIVSDEESAIALHGELTASRQARKSGSSAISTPGRGLAQRATHPPNLDLRQGYLNANRDYPMFTSPTTNEKGIIEN